MIVYLVDDKREDALETGGLDLVIVPGLGFTEVSQLIFVKRLMIIIITGW